MINSYLCSLVISRMCIFRTDHPHDLIFQLVLVLFWGVLDALCGLGKVGRVSGCRNSFRSFCFADFETQLVTRSQNMGPQIFGLSTTQR